MKIIEPYTQILTPLNPESAAQILQSIERAGRTCYKSEDRMTPESASRFVTDIVQVKHHESVIEHVSISVLFVVDRGVSHELVRHRLASFSQESTRYCNYSKGKFGSELTLVKPPLEGDNLAAWHGAMVEASHYYMKLVDAGVSPQLARSVLPNSLKTEVVMTANLREWRHVFRLRCSAAAHPQMQQVMRPLLRQFQMALPEVFCDIAF